MRLEQRIGPWLRPAVFLGSNVVTLAGAVITTSSGITLVLVFLFDFFLSTNFHPYAGILLFLVLPALFLFGLILMPAGALWRRRRLARSGNPPEVPAGIDFRSEAVRRALAWIVGLTFANVLILGLASYRGVEYMDSVTFCGQTCHTVMQPEFTTYQNSPHQRVACVQCHIGPGAGWFVRSKLSGVRQVVAVTFHTYDKPIPSPVEQLRPARETCEQCHWPQMFTGDKIVVRVHYDSDERNTAKTTVLVLKIGGKGARGAVGIHGKHLDTEAPIRYLATDRQRQTISSVLYRDPNGKQIEFRSSDDPKSARQADASAFRSMDCIDCHNRPTHVFQSPEEAVDEALSQGSISVDLPFIKKTAVEVLKANYPDPGAASQAIAARLDDFYRSSYPVSITRSGPWWMPPCAKCSAFICAMSFPP